MKRTAGSGSKCFGFTKVHGMLSFHPIPCGTSLIGHVTFGTTCTAYDQVPEYSKSSPASNWFSRLSFLPISLMVEPTLGYCRISGTSR